MSFNNQSLPFLIVLQIQWILRAKAVTEHRKIDLNGIRRSSGETGAIQEWMKSSSGTENTAEGL